MHCLTPGVCVRFCVCFCVFVCVALDSRVDLCYGASLSLFSATGIAPSITLHVLCPLSHPISLLYSPLQIQQLRESVDRLDRFIWPNRPSCGIATYSHAKAIPHTTSYSYHFILDQPQLESTLISTSSPTAKHQDSEQ